MSSLKEFIESFHLVMDKRRCTSHDIYLRSGIDSSQKVMQFVETLSLKTNTSWEIRISRPENSRLSFWKTWFCNMNDVDKQKKTRCSARIDIMVKRLTNENLKKDKFLSSNPPFPCLIHIKARHDHENNQKLYGVSPEVKEIFFTYFASGFSVHKARKQYSLQSNSSLSTRQIQNLRNLWSSSSEKERAQSKARAAQDNSEVFTLKQLLGLITRRKTQKISPSDSDPIQEETEGPPTSPTSKHRSNFPIVFESLNCDDESDGPVLFVLRMGAEGHTVSHKFCPKVRSLVINAIPVYSDFPFFDNSPSIPDVQDTPSPVVIKMEPAESDDESIDVCSHTVETKRVLPVIIAYATVDETSFDGHSTSDESDADASDTDLLPLVFTSIDSNMLESAPTVHDPVFYQLKQGPDGVQVTHSTSPQVLTVEIKAPRQEILNVEIAPLDIKPEFMRYDYPVSAEVCIKDDTTKHLDSDEENHMGSIDFDNSSPLIPEDMQSSSSLIHEDIQSSSSLLTAPTDPETIMPDDMNETSLLCNEDIRDAVLLTDILDPGEESFVQCDSLLMSTSNADDCDMPHEQSNLNNQQHASKEDCLNFSLPSSELDLRNNVNYQFFMSMLPHLEKCSPREQAIRRQKIQEIILSPISLDKELVSLHAKSNISELLETCLFTDC